MHIAICDDEKEIVDAVKYDIIEIQKDMEIQLKISTYVSGEELECDIDEHKQFDVVFLDIEIGKVNGIQLAEKIKKQCPTTAIVFMTGHCQYVYDVFDVQPCGFVKKPIIKERIEHVFKKAAEITDAIPTLTFHKNRASYQLCLKDVVYISSNKRVITVYTTDGEKTFYGKIDEIERTLKEKSSFFVRISQSVIINANFTIDVGYRSVTLKINEEEKSFNISQSYRIQAREAFLDLWKLS
jgi:DNA-binding LytR/AlgR family response regulator